MWIFLVINLMFLFVCCSTRGELLGSRMDFRLNSALVDTVTGTVALERQSLSLIGFQTAHQPQAYNKDG